uniref:Uncharacterized protein n=1 Tax=Ananas comosus var. bracteatus TaxID=296719 RepID=A0A6V7QV13_ANACO
MDPHFPINIAQLYHSEERQLFSRMVFTLGVDPSHSMKIIAFWLWLEENGHSDILRRINSFSDDMVLTVASVGQRFVEALYHDEPLPNPNDLSFEPTPTSVCFREKAFRGIDYFLNNVCRKLFDDHQARAEMESNTRQLETLARQMSHTYIDGKNLARSTATNNNLGQTSSSTFRDNSFTVTRTSNPQLFVPYGEGTSASANRITSHNLINPNLVEAEHAIESIYPSGALLGNLGFLQPRNSNIDVSIFRPCFNNAISPSNRQPIPIDHLTFGTNFSPQHYMAIFNRNLDILAQELPRARCDIPRDERTLFLTFSNGYPFTEDELYNFS